MTRRSAASMAAMSYVVAAIVALLVGIVVYLPSLEGGFVSDDFFFARTPLPLDPLALLGRTWEHPLGRATGYRPLTLFSYALNQAAGGSAQAFHMTNVVLHGLTSATSVLLAARLGAAPVGAFIAGICFALHPLHHEGVAWISGRTVVLSCALAAASLLAMTYHVRGWRSVWLATLLALLALLSYEGVLLLPAMLALVAWARRDERPLVRQALSALAPVTLVWVGYMAVRWIYISPPGGDAWSHSSAATAEGFAPPVLERTIANVGALATRLLGAGVGLDASSSLTFKVTAVVAGTCATAALLRRGSRRALLVILLMGAFAFLPFLTYTGYSDRFGHFASLAPCLAIGLGAGVVVQRGNGAAACTAIAMALMWVLWGRQLLLAQQDWVRAGWIAEQVQVQAVGLFPDPPPGARLRFVGVPLATGAAYVYITYFDRAMAQAYGRNDLRFSLSPDSGATCAVPDTTDPAIAACFRWDSESSRLTRVVQPST